MRRVEFDVDGDRYRLELHDHEVLTMSQRHAAGWTEIARLTVTAANVLADLDGAIPPAPVTPTRARRRRPSRDAS